MDKDNFAIDIIVIGGSAGSLQVILDLVKYLQPPLNFSIILVLHRKASASNLLENLIQQIATIPVIEVEDKTELKANNIYIAPGDYHLLFDTKQRLALDASEKINYSRPSIDVTFRSAAEVFGSRVLAILLSGANADGVIGLKAIQKNRGKIWIQNPTSAEVDYMPKKAIEKVEYDWLFNPEELAQKINAIL